MRTAKVVLWVPPPRAGAAPDGEADTAGLELTEPAPSSAKPLRFATPRPHSAVDVYGYPAQPSRPEGGGVAGILRHPVSSGLLPGQDDCYAIPPAWLSRAWPTTVVVEKDELLAELAESYNTSGRTFGDDKCARITTTGFTSGSAMDALAAGWPAEIAEGEPSPQVWMPSTSMWADLLRHRGRGSLLAPGPLKSVTSSVLVIAMPNRMARAVQDARAEPGWRDILDLSTNADGWAAVGHSEWGPFVLGRDNPNFSSSGLAASVAMYFAAADKDRGLTAEDLGRAEVTATVRGIESSVLRYGDEATEFMRSLYEEDRRGDATKPFVSAVLIQEQLAYLYNKGAPLSDLSTHGDPPKQKMTAVYPKEGTVAPVSHDVVGVDRAAGGGWCSTCRRR